MTVAIDDSGEQVRFLGVQHISYGAVLLSPLSPLEVVHDIENRRSPSTGCSSTQALLARVFMVVAFLLGCATVVNLFWVDRLRLLGNEAASGNNGIRDCNLDECFEGVAKCAHRYVGHGSNYPPLFWCRDARKDRVRCSHVPFSTVDGDSDFCFDACSFVSCLEVNVPIEEDRAN